MKWAVLGARVKTVEKGQNFLGLLHTIQAALKFTQSGILKKDELGSSLP